MSLKNLAPPSQPADQGETQINVITSSFGRNSGLFCIFMWLAIVITCTLALVSQLQLKTALYIQVIIPGSWIFAAIVNVPLFLAKNTKNKNGRILCVPTWPEVWMEAFIMILSVVVGVSLVLMIVLYSRVVHTLWFKCNDEHSLNNQQKVSAAFIIHRFLFSKWQLFFQRPANCDYS